MKFSKPQLKLSKSAAENFKTQAEHFKTQADFFCDPDSSARKKNQPGCTQPAELGQTPGCQAAHNLCPCRHHPGWRCEITVASAEALQPYPGLRVGLGKRNPWPAFRPKRRSLAASPQAQTLFVPHPWRLATIYFPKTGLAHSATTNVITKKTPLKSRPHAQFVSK